MLKDKKEKAHFEETQQASESKLDGIFKWSDKKISTMTNMLKDLMGVSRQHEPTDR